MGILPDFTAPQAVFLVLACWFCLGLGVLIGHFTRQRAAAPAEPEPVKPEPAAVSTAPRGAHHGPPTTEIPVQQRRRDDFPDVPPSPPIPGGRRRSDSPPMTRRQVRELREQGWYTGQPGHEEDPASPGG